MELLEEAGMADFEFEIVSIEGPAATPPTPSPRSGVCLIQREADGAARLDFMKRLHELSLSKKNWTTARSLGVQILSLAYRSGEAWNEFGFANEEFDALLAQANATADADPRREIMAQLQAIISSTRASRSSPTGARSTATPSPKWSAPRCISATCRRCISGASPPNQQARPVPAHRGGPKPLGPAHRARPG
jgi:ABC-type dipeptide transport system, periplasmic component